MGTNPEDSTQPNRPAYRLDEYQPIRIERRDLDQTRVQQAINPSIEENKPAIPVGRSVQPAVRQEFKPEPLVRTHSGRMARNANAQRRRFFWFTLIVFVLLYFFAPLRTNILILGADGAQHRGEVGRTDTIILATVIPLKPYIGLLSVPRDLWINLPGYGQNRINTAYYFAELNQPGSGGEYALHTVQENFGVGVDHYLVVHMHAVSDVVDALGGIDVSLGKPMGGLPAGDHHLDGSQALAFVRERYSADDFSRMQQSQIVVMAALKKGMTPSGLTRTPLVATALLRGTETDIPAWMLPRLGFALARGMLTGLDTRIITREMVNPFQTSGGAQVLGPNWQAINPVLMDMFGE